MANAPANYHEIIAALKARIKSARQKAAILVNTELLQVYWEIGKVILEQQKDKGWGAKVIDRMATDLKAEFPDMKGMSVRNLKYMRTFADSWPEFGQAGLAQSGQIVQVQLAQLPWYHHLTLLDKVKDRKQRLFYIARAIENGWSLMV